MSTMLLTETTKVGNMSNNVGEYCGSMRRLHDVIGEKYVDEIGPTVDAKLRWLRSQIIGGMAEIRTPFGKRKLTYADHTASGRCLQYIEEYIIRVVLPFYGNTHTSDSYVGNRTTKMLHEATEIIKKCLGGTQDDALLFCGSGTTAAIKQLQEVIGITIPSILKEKVLNSCVGSQERWVVFVGPYEHHSNLLSWRQTLAEVIEIGLDDEGLINIHDLKSRLQFYQATGRPMLGSFSACSNVTGICSDTRSISRLLHHFGAFACFDFAASGPYVEIEMRSGAIDGYDAIALGPHKFLGGPGSPGILLINKALYHLENSPPSTCGGGTVDFVNCFNEKDTLYVHDIEQREDAGTPSIIPRIKAALAFQIKEYITCEVIAKKEVDYIERAIKRLEKNPKIWVLGNTNTTTNSVVERMAIISFLVYTTTYSSTIAAMETRGKPLNGAFVAKLMNDLFGIEARGGCACAGPYAHRLLRIDEPYSLEIKTAIEMGYNGATPGSTRVSFPYYMSKEEYEFILSAIEFVAVYGQRFLSLYHLNWNTGSWSLKDDAFVKNLVDCNRDAPKLLQVIKRKTTEKAIDCEAMDDGDFDKLYASYLEVAKHIANKLPKFPTQRIVPKEIDLNHVFFRV